MNKIRIKILSEASRPLFMVTKVSIGVRVIDLYQKRPYVQRHSENVKKYRTQTNKT